MIFVARKKSCLSLNAITKTIFCQKNFNEWHLPRLYDIKKHEIEQHWQVSAQLLQQYYTHPEPQQDFDIFSRRFFVTSTIVSCCHHWFGSNAEDHWLLSGQRWSFFQGNFFIFPLSSSSYHLTFKSCCCCLSVDKVVSVLKKKWCTIS